MLVIFTLPRVGFLALVERRLERVDRLFLLEGLLVRPDLRGLELGLAEKRVAVALEEGRFAFRYRAGLRLDTRRTFAGAFLSGSFLGASVDDIVYFG